MAGPIRLLAPAAALALVGAVLTEARWHGGATAAFMPAGGPRLQQHHQALRPSQQQESRRRPLATPLSALGGGRFFPLDGIDFHQDEDEEERAVPFRSSSEEDEGATAALADSGSRRPRALSALLSLEEQSQPPQSQQQQRQRRPGQLASSPSRWRRSKATTAAAAAAAAATTSTTGGSSRRAGGAHQRRRRAPLQESLRGDQGRRPAGRSWRRRGQQEEQRREEDAAAAAAAATVVSTFLGGAAGAGTTTPYHRNYQPPPAPVPVPPRAAPAAAPALPLHLAHPRFRTEDDGADAAGWGGYQGLAKAAGLLAGCEWRFSEVTAVEPVSPDGSVRRVRLEPLPGLPSLIPHHISARQPGQYLGLRVPVYDPAVSLTKPARVFRILAPVASAPERVGPREYVDVLLDGREELVLPCEEEGGQGGDANVLLERALRCLLDSSSSGSKDNEEGGAAPTPVVGPEAERKAWSRLLSEGGLKVGAVLDVSEEVGPGFVSFLAGPRLALPAMLHEHRDLLILARGTAGMAAVGSALDWHKVQGAHAAKATKQSSKKQPRITVLMEVDTAAHDPLRGARARWQAALGPNVRVVPVLRPPRAQRRTPQPSPPAATVVTPGGGVEAALFKGPNGAFSPVLGIEPKECAVLVAGMGKRRRARLATSLLKAGVHPARILDHSLDLARGPGVAPPVERCEQQLPRC